MVSRALQLARFFKPTDNNLFDNDLLDFTGSEIDAGDLVTVAKWTDLPAGTAGQKAYVTSTKSIHFHDGTEWDKVSSGLNLPPQFTTIPPTSLALNADGTPNTISVVAIDPEYGSAIFPMKYDYKIVSGSDSYTSSSGTFPNHITSIASGYDSTGSFIITPSASNAGSSIFTSIASDGVKTVRANTNLSLSFGPGWLGGRGILMGGGHGGSYFNTNRIEYFTIATTSNGASFGNLANGNYWKSSASNGTYGFYHANSAIEKITIATTGNASTTGYLNSGSYDYDGACDGGIESKIIVSGAATSLEHYNPTSQANSTTWGSSWVNNRYNSTANDDSRMMMIGGRLGLPPYEATNDVYYVSMTTPGNASSFGTNHLGANHRNATASDGTYALSAGGHATNGGSGGRNDISVWTVQTLSNGSDFGNLSQSIQNLAGVSNGTRAVFCGGSFQGAAGTYTNVMEYVTFSTPGNTTDFGDLIQDKFQAGSCSGS